MVVLCSVEALSSHHRLSLLLHVLPALMTQQVIDDDELDDSEDVEEGEENVEDDNNDHNDQTVIKRKRKHQQVVSITSRITVINWMITDGDQNDEQGLILGAIA